MTTEVLVPTLAFGTMLALLIFGVLGVKGAKEAKREEETSALARVGDANSAADDRSEAAAR